MDFVSDEQRKAIMASYRNRGTLRPRSNSSYLLSQRCSLEPIPKQIIEKTKKELELQKEIDAYERTKKHAVEDEIKHILAVEVPEKQEAKRSLSYKLNGVIINAVQVGIDRNIIVKLREIQVQLITNIPNTIIIVKLQELQQQLVTNIPKYLKCLYCHQSFKTEFGRNYHIRAKHPESFNEDIHKLYYYGSAEGHEYPDL